MSNYRLDVKGLITLGDYSNIYDSMGMINKNDSLTITIGEGNEKELEIVKSILKYKDFLIDEDTKDVDREYFITAHKKI